jgi:hypothetical protein
MAVMDRVRKGPICVSECLELEFCWCQTSLSNLSMTIIWYGVVLCGEKKVALVWQCHRFGIADY